MFPRLAHNLGIPRLRNAISKLHTFQDCVEHIYFIFCFSILFAVGCVEGQGSVEHAGGQRLEPQGARFGDTHRQATSANPGNGATAEVSADNQSRGSAIKVPCFCCMLPSRAVCRSPWLAFPGAARRDGLCGALLKFAGLSLRLWRYMAAIQTNIG